MVPTQIWQNYMIEEKTNLGTLKNVTIVPTVLWQHYSTEEKTNLFNLKACLRGWFTCVKLALQSD